MNARYIARITYVVLILISILIPNQLMFLTLNVSLAYIPLELAYLIKFLYRGVHLNGRFLSYTYLSLY